MTLIPSLTFTDYEWFPWSICNGCGMPAGNAYPSGHLVPSPIVGLACAPIVETRFLQLAMSLLDFSPRIPLGTFSILLKNDRILLTGLCRGLPSAESSFLRLSSASILTFLLIPLFVSSFLNRLVFWHSLWEISEICRVLRILNNKLSVLWWILYGFIYLEFYLKLIYE